MDTPVLYDLSSRRQLYDLIYHQESMQGGKPLEINEFEERFDQLNIELFHTAYSIIFKRHEGLRTIFRLINNEIKQEIHPYSSARFHVKIFDLSDLEPEEQTRKLEVLSEGIRTEFADVQVGPLAKGILFKVSAYSYTFRFFCHHILSDGYSMKLLYTEIKTVYERLVANEALDLPTITITCREFLLQRNSVLNGNYEAKLYGYWEKKLEQYLMPPEVSAVYSKFRHKKDIKVPADDEILTAKKNMHMARWLSYTTSFERKKELIDLSMALGVTPNVVLMGVFFVCVHICYNTSIVMAVSTIPGRNDKASRQIFGNLFCNIFMKSACDPSMSLKEIMMKIYMDFLQSCRYPIFEFHKLDRFETREKCEFFVNFLDINDTKDIKISAQDNYKHKLDKEYYSLSYIVNEYKNGFTFRWAYQDSIYTPAIIECLSHFHLAVLEAFLQHPEKNLQELQEYCIDKHMISI